MMEKDEKEKLTLSFKLRERKIKAKRKIYKIVRNVIGKS